MVDYRVNIGGGFNAGKALQDLGEQWRENQAQEEVKSQREQMQGLLLKARQGDTDAMDQVIALNPDIGIEYENHQQKMIKEKGLARAEISSKKTNDWSMQWQNATPEQKEQMKQAAYDDDDIDFGDDEQSLSNEQFDFITKLHLRKEFGDRAVRGNQEALTERQRNLKTLQSMPTDTEQQRRERDEAAYLFGAKPKSATIDDKIRLDKSKQQTKEEHAISLARKKSKNERLQGFIDSGVSSAENLITINNSIGLLDEIETGGVDKVLLKAKQMLGVESADEAELTYNLGKNVLQQLKPTFGAAFTVREMMELKSMEAGLGKSVEGNKRILKRIKVILDRSARRGMRAAKEQGDSFTYNEINSLMSGNQKQNSPTLSDEDLVKKYGG